MSFHTLRYKLDEDGVQLMLGCAAEQVIQEQGEAIAHAYRFIDVTISIDDDWGICEITHVNGRKVEEV